MSDILGAFLPMIAFMLFPIVLPIVGSATGAMRDAVRGTQ